MFIFPVKKEGGAFYVLLAQWSGPHCLLTYIEDYRANPATAQPYMYLTTYSDFAARKDLVLMRAEFLPYLLKREAHRLMNDVQDFYLRDSEKWEHVRTFTHDPARFDFNAVFGIKA